MGISIGDASTGQYTIGDRRFMTISEAVGAWRPGDPNVWMGDQELTMEEARYLAVREANAYDVEDYP